MSTYYASRILTSAAYWLRYLNGLPDEKTLEPERLALTAAAVPMAQRLNLLISEVQRGRASELLRLYALGRSEEEIAKALNLNPKTIHRLLHEALAA